MKKIAVAFIAFSAVWVSILSAEPWKKTLDLGFNLTQNTYSDSWVGGEAGNIAWVSRADGIFEKQFTLKFNFKSTWKLAFGQTHSQDKDTKHWAKPEKSTDKIDIENLARFTLQAFVDPYAALRFESQFLDASVASVKRYINPMLWTQSAGIAKILYARDKDELLTRLGFAVREFVDAVIIDTAAGEKEWDTKVDGGLESVTDFKYALSPSLTYIGKLSLYKAFFFSDKDEVEGTPMEDYWKAVDVNFEYTLSAAVAKYITVSLYAQLLYDKQIEKKGRFKETLAMGVTFKMF